ncbi:CPBP family intramembrane metalloprotease, partial [Microvirga sp. 3-52]|nr:CPBP family intramembrane metalloprotease [Microvirga sp. 3-52]
MFGEMKIRHLIGVTALFLVPTMVILFFLLLFSDGNVDFISATFGFVFYVVVPVVYFGYDFRKQKLSIRQVVYTKGVTRWIPSIFGIVIISIAFSLSAFWLYLYLLSPVLPFLVDFLLEETPMPESGLFLAFEIIMITILAPIVEEFFFRGVILQRLIKKSSVWGGILISSILFGILHADIIGAFIFGVITALLVIRTGNLLIPILLHMLNNTLAVLLMYVPPTWVEWLDVIA